MTSSYRPGAWEFHRWRRLRALLVRVRDAQGPLRRDWVERPADRDRLEPRLEVLVRRARRLTRELRREAARSGATDGEPVARAYRPSGYRPRAG